MDEWATLESRGRKLDETAVGKEEGPIHAPNLVRSRRHIDRHVGSQTRIHVH